MGTIIAAVIILALSVAVSVGSFLIVDHVIPAEMREARNDVAGFV